MEEPIRGHDKFSRPGERTIDKPELPRQGLLVEQYAECEAEEGGQLKVGRHRHFEVLCDEPEGLGGEDRYPQPLTYICMGVGF